MTFENVNKRQERNGVMTSRNFED